MVFQTVEGSVRLQGTVSGTDSTLVGLDEPSHALKVYLVNAADISSGEATSGVFHINTTASGAVTITGAGLVDVITQGSALTISGSGSVDHGGLTGLGDDDHTQYSLVDGSRDFTGNISTTASSPTAAKNLTRKDYVDGEIATVSGHLQGNIDGKADSSHTHTEADITDLGSYLENVVEDTSPQLGGNLDAQSNDITSVGTLSGGTGTFTAGVTVSGEAVLTSSSQTGNPLTVEEADGSPQVSNVTTIKFSNGTVTDDGGGVVSVSNGGGGGGVDDVNSINGSVVVTGTNGIQSQTAGSTITLNGENLTLHTEHVTTSGHLQTQIDGKAASSHTHAAGDITSGTFDDARVAESNVTQHESAITHQNLSGAGTNTHAQIDSHISDSTLHFTEASIDHTNISNVGTNTHAQIDTHLAALAASGTNNTDSDVNETITGDWNFSSSLTVSGEPVVIGTEVPRTDVSETVTAGWNFSTGLTVSGEVVKTSFAGLIEAATVNIPTVSGDTTVFFFEDAPYACTVKELVHNADGGSATATVYVAGTEVEGLDNITFNSSKSTSTATSANSVSKGDSLFVSISGNSGLVESRVQLNLERS